MNSNNKSHFTGQILHKIQVWRRNLQAEEDCVRNERLVLTLSLATGMMERVARDVYEDQCRHSSFLCRSFSMITQRDGCHEHGEGAACTLVHSARSWLQTHEEAQVMIASVLVVVGLWWLVRTVLSLFINLVCPVLVVLLAVVMVPQLRAPLLGQNYPVLANLLHRILTKLAENIKEN